jgi:hypothetical protein
MARGSAYQIQNGLKTGNTAPIANTIDFDSVRVSLRPTVEHEIENSVPEALAKAGPAAAVLSPKLKQQMLLLQLQKYRPSRNGSLPPSRPKPYR